jgi:hypothetical protein
LVLKWDEAGNVVWGQTWGDAGQENEPSTIVYRGNLYVTGRTASFGETNGDVFLLKYDLDGNLIWAVTTGGDQKDSPLDLAGSYVLLGQTAAIHITGYTKSFGVAGEDIIHIKFKDDGSLLEFQTWHGEDLQRGESIINKGIAILDLYIAGWIGTTDYSDEVLLLEVGSGNGLMQKTWGEDDVDIAYAVDWTGEEFVLAGYTKSFSGGFNGLLISFTAEGAVLSVETYSYNDEEFFYDVCEFPHEGLLLGGTSYAVGGTWTPVVGALRDASGVWTTQIATAISQTGVSAPANGSVETDPSGVFDTGGVGPDALVIAY